MCTVVGGLSPERGERGKGEKSSSGQVPSQHVIQHCKISLILKGEKVGNITLLIH